MKLLVIDIGGTNIKIYRSGHSDVHKIPSGKKLTPEQMAKAVRRVIKGWRYDAISMGYPGPVVRGYPLHDPANLGPGWVGFDFKKAFHPKPILLINDAALQALGSYQGGRMLFLGLGTGLGSAAILDGELEPMELAHLPYLKGRSYEYFLGEAGLRRLGRRKWEGHVHRVVAKFREALLADYVVLGGGNVKRMEKLPALTLRGDNANALVGGERLWEVSHGTSRKPLANTTAWVESVKAVTG
jgi:polyphosphate glucokinase